MKSLKIAFTTMIVFVLLVAPATGQQFRNAPMVYIDVADTMTDDPESKLALADFDKALAAAIVKKKVPVTLVTERGRAHWIMEGSSSQSEGGRAAAVKTLIFGSGNSAKTEVTIKLVDIENSMVAYAYYVTIKKDNFKSAAEDFANRFKKDLTKRR